MNYFEALEASAPSTRPRPSCPTPGEFTIREDKVLIDPETGGTTAEPDDHGEYAGSDIIEFLGY